MDTGLPLFEYPVTAGNKENTTSREAAEGIEKHGRAARLRDDVLAYYRAGNRATADECAKALDENPLSVRPRIAELHTRGSLKSTGTRRKSLSGGRASHEWFLA